MTRSRIGILSVVTALLVMSIIISIPKDIGTDVIAGLVAFAGGVYFGISLKSDTNRKTFLNILVSILFLGLFFLGIWVHFSFHAAAFILHAAWDAVVDKHDHVKFWYMPICVPFDIILGIFILIWFMP